MASKDTEKSNPTDTEKSESNKENNNRDDMVHLNIQNAHDKYFADINNIFNELQQKFQTIQIEYERSAENACQNQDFNDLQTANAEYQRNFNEICKDADFIEYYNESYKNYKLAVQNTITNAKVDDMNFTDMAHLSQSLCVVSQTAMALGSQAQNMNFAMQDQLVNE